MLANPFKLKKLGILGMNNRNINYIGKHNDRKNFPLVDNKLKTKKLAQEHNISVPELLGYIQYQVEINHFEDYIKNQDGFVIKPAQGSGGKGILVIVKRVNDKFIKPSGEELNYTDIKRHISNILSGLYSLGGRNDVAVFEKLVDFDNAFDGFSYEGVPDVRVIVYQGFPTLSMMRLSTSNSDGKANLHQGAVGVGIDIKTGKALNAVQFGKPITTHPDTNRDLKELVVPYWDDILHLSARCYEMTNMGYLGADIVIDKTRGPLVLELNARPGLAIQIANDIGALKKFNLIDELKDKNKSLEEKVAFAKEHF
ncbi:alpha-L-glutamate ligase-like protein [Halarcobacter bivalviorum]|uniref:alpha-L-glutamate ligase-like protein n=1 Tax=Halarcobacter bivalviorum TaxID=663364 RepID=UPI00100ADF89|nr:alpha-L-glutamate ligase-like protein [Halarcobacter bivalviorum]RXK07816.1 alpha-L-glutamate ligase-like protein [Halarcobacter bivalviorum]